MSNFKDVTFSPTLFLVTATIFTSPQYFILNSNKNVLQAFFSLMSKIKSKTKMSREKEIMNVLNIKHSLSLLPK